MGEPLYNYNAVRHALTVLSADDGLAISRRKLIVSTSGVAPNIRKLADEFPTVSLAVSLHATNDEMRSQLMDINDKWPLKELFDALVYHQSRPQASRLTFEYILLAGINDSIGDAKDLVKILSPFRGQSGCCVNLIPFNGWASGLKNPFKTPSIQSTQVFQDYLANHGLPAPIRRSRGRKIQAACGQLAKNYENNVV